MKTLLATTDFSDNSKAGLHFAVQLGGPPEDLRVRIIMFPPESVADHRDRLEPVFLLDRKGPSELGMDSEERKKISRDWNCSVLHGRLSGLRQALAPALDVSGDVFKNSIVVTLVEIIPGRLTPEAVLAIRRPDIDESTGLVKGQRLQQQAVEHGKSGGVNPEAKGKSRESHDGKSRILHQRSHAKSDVLPKRPHQSAPWRFLRPTHLRRCSFSAVVRH